MRFVLLVEVIKCCMMVCYLIHFKVKVTKPSELEMLHHLYWELANGE